MCILEPDDLQYKATRMQESIQKYSTSVVNRVITFLDNRKFDNRRITDYQFRVKLDQMRIAENDAPQGYSPVELGEFKTQIVQKFEQLDYVCIATVTFAPDYLYDGGLEFRLTRNSEKNLLVTDIFN